MANIQRIMTHFEENEQIMYKALGKDAFERFHTYIVYRGIPTKQITPSHVYEWCREQVSVPVKKHLTNIEYWQLPSDIQITNHKFYVMYFYWVYGKKHFHLEEGLAHMLVQTDVHEVKGSLLNLPFPCIYVTVPEDLVGIQFTDEGTCLYEGVAQGAYITEVEKDGDLYWEVMMFLQMREYETGRKTGGTGYVGIRFRAGEDRNIFDVIKEILDTSFPSVSLLTDPGKYYFNRNSRIIAERFLLLIVNTLLYLQSDKAVVEHVVASSPNRNTVTNKKKKKKDRNRYSTSYIRVGKTVTIDPKQRKIYTESNVLQQHGNGQRKKSSNQWLVRGHWRNQAHGESLKERKLIWIQPYVKGTGAMEEKQYVIK